MKKSLMIMVLFYMGVFAQNITVVFMGILPGGAPEFEKRFDALLREQVTVLPGVNIADYDGTQYLKKKVDFVNSPVITRSFVEKLMLVSSEKTLVVWGDISHFNIKPVRRWLVGAEAVGTLTLSLTMYSLDFGEYAFIGDISCQASVPKAPVFFRSVDKVTHITTSDRSTIIAKLQNLAAQKSTDVINGVIKSQMVKSGVLRPDEVKTKKVPSVSDLFDIPTVEARDVVEDKEEETEQSQQEEVEQESEEAEKIEEVQESEEIEEEKE